MISVIIPTHDRPDYLQCALSSLLRQSLSDWEAIIVDNGAHQSAQAIVAAAGDQRLKYMVSPPHNRSLARNAGAAAATGAFLAFLDDDDCLLPDSLLIQADYLESHPDVGLVAGGAELINAAGEHSGRWELWKHLPALTLDKCIEQCPLMPSATLMRRIWFERVGGFDAALPLAEDMDLFLRLLLAGCRMEWVHELTCQYRVHAGGSQGDAVHYAQGRALMLERILSHPQLPESISQRGDEIRASYALTAFAQYAMSGDDEVARSQLQKALEYRPELRRADAELVVKSLLGACSKVAGASDPFALFISRLPLAEESLEIAPGIRRKGLIEAAQMSLYKGYEAGDSWQVCRAFAFLVRHRATCLSNRGTWVILVKALRTGMLRAVRRLAAVVYSHRYRGQTGTR